MSASSKSNVLSLREREEHIRKILQQKIDYDKNEIVTTEDVRRRWAEYLEKSCPKCPWLAKVKNIVVDVVEVDWCNFQAIVEVLDEEQEGTQCPLVELTPISVDEDKDSLDKIKQSIEALHHFRFFMNNLWFPWDEDDDGDNGNDSDENWIAEHLGLRFMALESDAFHRLKKLSRDYQEIKDSLNGDDDNIVVSLNSHERLNRIKKVAGIIEDPEISMEFVSQRRKEKEKGRLFDIKRGYSIDRQAVLVWQNGGKSDEYLNMLDSLKIKIPFDDPHIIVKDNLQDAIDCCIPNDAIVLAPGEYDLDDVGDLASSLSIFGLGNDPSKIVIKLNSGYGYEVVLNKGYGYFEAVTVTSKTGQGGFWIKDGASLEVKDCRMVGFHNPFKVTGEKASLKLKWSEIQASRIGLKAEEGGKIHMIGGLIEDCDVGISAETIEKEPGVNIKIEEVDNYATVKYDFLSPQHNEN